MEKRLKDKVAIVTGAGSILAGMGNGKATAIVFAREGAKVMAVDYNLEAAEETKRIIDEEGGECITFKADVSKASDCQSMVEKCVQAFSRVDILHNNVGMGGYGGPVETSEEIWDKTIAVNLKSMFLTCKYVLPCMEKQGSGVIINISSLNAIRVQPAPAIAYACSKAGVVALTREVALQYAELMWKRRDAMSPTEKQGEPWDVAYAALFLASDEAKYITGTTLLVDGGISGTMKQR